ncbi:MAG: serine/threonine protein kinase [Clostridiales bacterium]|nr:serine/threonine protein kinase [Clostridiales bacterium]
MRETPAPRQYPCPFCGGDDRTLTLCSPALPPRTVLDRRYVVGGTLGQGGFGITYRAYDLRMGNTVAVKEYFPSSLVGRDSSVSTTVTVNAIKGTRALDEYASGLRHFLFEARRQAKLASSPGVVSVTDFFEANNTAYYIMEYVDGSTLVKYMKRPLPLEQVLDLLEPISDSLVSIHEAGLIHRDISPDNIMCAKNGQRKLLDFGASHSFTEEESTTGNATLKHGFAPPEQYGSSNLQGPWTDVYAFAATVYWCLTGKIPPDSMDRSIGGDKLMPPSALGAAVTPEAEAVLLRGMALPDTDLYNHIPP